jgi:hypothetical protein
MKPKVLLRIAAGAILLFDLGHTLGGMILAPSHGPEEDELLAKLGAYTMDVMGSTRSHLDFYDGSGWYLSLTLTALLAITWLMSSAVDESPQLVKRLAVVLALWFGISAALCVVYFFAAPLVTSVIACAALTAAALRL